MTGNPSDGNFFSLLCQYLEVHKNGRDELGVVIKVAFLEEEDGGEGVCKELHPKLWLMDGVI